MASEPKMTAIEKVLSDYGYGSQKNELQRRTLVDKALKELAALMKCREAVSSWTNGDSGLKTHAAIHAADAAATEAGL